MGAYVTCYHIFLIKTGSNFLETVFDALVKLTCFASLQELNSGKDRVS